MTSDVLSLGGPGPGCSKIHVRRLMANELKEPEAEALRAHVAGCLRCQAAQAEVARERADVERALPFDQFAAGVAERLAAPTPSRRLGVWQLLPLAAAAAVAIVAIPALKFLGPGTGEEPSAQNRVKGSAGATVFVKDDAGKRELRADEQVADHAQLLISLRPAGAKYAAAALWEPASVSLLYVGEARPGPLPSAFEWDGRGRAAIVVRFASQPIDSARFAEELRKGGPAAAGPESWVLPLSRP